MTCSMYIFEYIYIYIYNSRLETRRRFVRCCAYVPQNLE